MKLEVGKKAYWIYEHIDVLVTDINGDDITIYDEDTEQYFVVGKNELGVQRYQCIPTTVNSGYYDTRNKENIAICDTSILKVNTLGLTDCSISNQENKTKNNILGGKKMNIKNLFGKYGKVESGKVALTLGGQIAVRRSADEYVRYDEEKEQIVNHMSMVLEQTSKFFYIFPVTEVKEGDIIEFKDTFYQVLKVLDNGSLISINLSKGTKSTICKETNVFGFNFYYKVTSLVDGQGFGATTGGFNPMMLMLLGDKKESLEDLLPLMMMQGQANGSTATNPLLMMSLLGDGKSDMKDIMMLQALAGGQGLGDTAGGFNPMMLMLLDK